MTSDNSPTKKESTPKASAPSGGAAKSEGSKSEGSKTDASKSEGKAPSNYSRGENQKPVTDSYKENWNAIYGKKKPKRRK
jgi:hypothetical protein